MNYLVLDIETVGKPYDEFDEKSKEIFNEWAERESRTEEDLEKSLESVKEGFPFSPFLGEIVSVAILDGDDNGAVYFQAPDEDMEDWEDEGVKYRVGTEAEILERFWDVASHYDCFITFNGRGFDIPYLMIRSAVHGIKPTQNLLSNRYLPLQRGAKHIDLQDQLTFYGAMFRKPKLHFAAQAFGIESPKREGEIEGKDVPKAFHDKRYKEIAQYNYYDVIATRELYRKWDEYLNM
ncbi:MAG: ribonuclease H-like domain-containing protein [Candidatus Spechtbacterales bacterium]